MGKALEDITIIDFTRVLSGPYATMLLADMGAQVWKIERPGKGDDSRAVGPFRNGESAYFMSLNRNKKSVTVDLSSPEGKEIVRRLVTQCDVLVENFRPGTMEKLGLGYHSLNELNPRLIFASCSGFGQTGPYRERPAYDIIVQGMGGLMSITGESDGSPTRVGTSIGDIAAGLFTAIAILAALNKRNKTNRGEYIDVSMLDCQVAILENAIARCSMEEKIPRPLGNRHPSIAPFSVYQTKDGSYITVAAGTDKLWAKLCQAINRLDLLEDSRFQTNMLRNDNWAALDQILHEAFSQHVLDAWVQTLNEYGIPFGPINTIDQVLKDPQVRHRDMIVEVEHPIAGKVEIANNPIKFLGDPNNRPLPAPLLGQHTEECLEKLGYTRTRIEGLVRLGVV